MTLADWLSAQGNPPSRREMGRQLGVSHSYVCMLVRGRRSPSLALALRIETLTGGAVTTQSWRTQ
jgi:DNA-binding transcriptional regulator YdaS (Cro superfamily)